jgi:hypothetical protein
MARASRQRFQVNVPLEDGHWHVALLQLAIRDGKSVPELLRPIIITYLKRQLTADPKLAAAVANIEESRSLALDKSRRRRNLAEIKTIRSGDQSPVRKTGKPASGALRQSNKTEP